MNRCVIIGGADIARYDVIKGKRRIISKFPFRGAFVFAVALPVRYRLFSCLRFGFFAVLAAMRKVKKTIYELIYLFPPPFKDTSPSRER